MGEVIPMIKPKQRRVVERAIGAALSGPNAEHNERILRRMQGKPLVPSTPETDADPRNPNVIFPRP